MRYEVGEFVVFKHEHDGSNQVGLVTNRRFWNSYGDCRQ
jgi:hypothetical protein